MSAVSAYSARKRQLAIECAGNVAPECVERAAAAVAQAFERYRIGPHGRIRLTGGRCGRGQLLAQVNVDRSGVPLRVQLPVPDCGDLSPLISRLQRQLGGGPHRWPDPHRPPLSATADAVIARRKTVAAQNITVREAITALDALDFEAHLFVDAETGEDAVVYRAGPSGLRLARQHRAHPPGHFGADMACTVPVVVTPRQTPVLPLAKAAARVRTHALPYLFFTDSASGRGQLLYTRYDGQLTLLSAHDPGHRGGAA